MNQSKFTTKDLAQLSLFTAVAVVGRIMFQFIPNVQPMTDVLLLLTIYQGVKRGLTVTILSVLITSLYLGMGLWTVSQIISYTILILLTAVISKSSYFREHLWIQTIYAFSTGFLYGFIISIFESKFYGIKAFVPYYLAGLSFDFMHAVGNGGFYLLLMPILSKWFKKNSTN